MSAFVSMRGGRSSAGTTAARVLAAIACGLPVIGLVASSVGALVGVLVDDADSKGDAKERRDWFETLGDDGVTRGDWHVHYDHAVNTPANVDGARSYAKNVGALRDRDWGGRQAPRHRSRFDVHRDAFAGVRTNRERDRGADTDVEREQDPMDEVEQDTTGQPTCFPGCDDQVLDP